VTGPSTIQSGPTPDPARLIHQEAHITDTVLIAKARKIVPLILEARDAGERQRRLPASVLAALHEAELFRMMIPRDVGGLQVDPITSTEVVETIAAADGATGWSLMIGMAYGLWAARLPLDAARTIYGAANAVVAGALRPVGRLRPVEGGVVASGHWTFASGINHSKWWLGCCVVYEADMPKKSPSGETETRLVFFPAEQGELIDSWDAGGMRGTGSHDYAVKDVFIPAERVILVYGPSRLADPLYRMPQMVLLDSAMAAVPLGIARTAIDTFVQLAGGKKSHGFANVPAARPTIQADVGRAEAVLHAARAWLYRSLEETWRDVQAGREIGIRQTTLLRLARANAVTASIEAVDLMYAAGAGTAVYSKSPLDRCFRDVHVAFQHVALHPSNYEVCGRVMLGLPPDRTVL
jgi:alkylation response protein AidB-like acyl-CoA dehydrogenase